MKNLLVFIYLFTTGTLMGVSYAFAGAEPYPLEYWALRDAMTNVEVSPDGKHLALMKIPNRDGNPIIEIYDAANLEKKPVRINADPMEFTQLDWISDTGLVFLLRQKVRDRIEGWNEGVYDFQLATLDIETEKFRTFSELNPGIEHLLPSKPGKVIISFNEGSRDSSKLAEPFRPRSYHEFDLKRGTKKLLIRGKISLGQIEFDGEGNPWIARGFDRAKREYTWFVRQPGESGWETLYRLSEDRHDDFVVEGMDVADRNVLFVSTQNGHDKIGLWEYSSKAKAFGPLIYRRDDVDVAGVRNHSNYWTNPDAVVGVAYYQDKLHIKYFDEIEQATYEQLESLVPNAYQLRITSRSRDGQTLTVYNRGPHDPGTYYLLKDGRFQTIGTMQPLIKTEDLADVEYITYPARDGRTIPAYVTIPKGQPPFPTIVLPHGGPFVQEVVGYDEWGQMLANNGYLVIQPQYRGSRGYGLDHYTSAFREGGQGGYKMQDDKDDGALHLVEKGLADRNRIAMFGWSYGGYAALVAASRRPQIYQCTIAGAAVADQMMQRNYFLDRLRGSLLDSQLKYRNDSVNPIKEVSKVNVPLLLVHGDVDQRVPPEHAKNYQRELDRYKKNYEFVELEGADHFYDTLFYNHQLTLYESMISFLKEDCGPGGL